ncbi:hypothetical protein Maq22A_c00815 [Methylobacterium aquaticum]|uniref:Uncharacterized protein n=1 Tax=Methylobacterium aquaticum TaxID=270351 RepID=A0A0C6FF75_9HYPH|nr:hypothetical protein Maq22A_c00815 [Methylobacterium aquaticum]
MQGAAILREGGSGEREEDRQDGGAANRHGAKLALRSASGNPPPGSAIRRSGTGTGARAPALPR